MKKSGPNTFSGQKMISSFLSLDRQMRLLFFGPSSRLDLIRKLISVLFLVTLLGSNIYGATKTWLPTTGGAWTTSGNWSPSGAPTTGDAVIINNNQSAAITAVPTISLLSLSVSGNCTLAGSAAPSTITITSSFTVATTFTLTVGNATNTTRIHITLSNTSSGIIDGTVNLNSGSNNAAFTNSGNLSISSTGVIAEAGTSSGSDFILSSGATLNIGSTLGIIANVGTASGNIQVSQTRTFSAGANYVYNGTSNQNTGTGLPSSLTGSLTINNPGNTVTLVDAARTITTGTLNLTAGTFATSPAGTNRLSLGSTATLNRSEGSITGTLQGTNTYDVNYTGNTKTTGPELSGGGLRNVVVNLSANQVLTLDQNRVPDGNLTITAGTLDLSTYTLNRSAAGGTLTVAGTLVLGGISGGQTGSNFPTNYSTLTMTGGTVNYDCATGGQTIYSTPAYATLTLGNTSGTQSAGGNLTVTTLNNNTNIADILNLSTFTLSVTTPNNTGTIKTQNTSGTPVTTGKTWGGTFIYDGVAQTVSSGTYNNLTLSGSLAKTTAASVNINGILSMEGTATTAGTAPTLGAAATIQYMGSSAQITGIEFPAGFAGTGGLIINNALGVTLSVSPSIYGPLELTAGALNLNGKTLTIASTGSHICGTGTIDGLGSAVIINGATATNLPAGTYQNLTINRSGGVSLCGNTTINGTLTLQSGTFSVGGNTLTLLGPAIANTPTNLSTTSASSLVIGGLAAGLALPSSVSLLNNLTLNNANGLGLGTGLNLAGNLTLTSGNLTLGNNDITVSGSVLGSFDNSHMVVLSGSGSLVKQGSNGADFVATYPIGTGTIYTPVQINSLSATTIAPGSTIKFQSVATASSGILGNFPLNRHWITSSTGITGSVLVNISLTFNASDIPPGGNAALYEIMYKPNAGSWSKPNGSGIAGSNPLTASAATSVNAEWSASVPIRRSFYTLKTGSWDDPTTWTLDPSGALPLNPDNITPTTSASSANDDVTILSGRSVTVPTGTKVNNDLTVIGTLDFGTTTGHSFSTISGTGKIRLAGDNFPAGDATDFISAGQGEGTVEFYGLSRNTVPPHAFFNVIVNMTTGNILTLTSNLTLNGGLTVSNGTLNINNNSSTTALTINVYGNITVATTGKILTGSANARHQLNIYGNLTNNGEVRFTNRIAANYSAEATDGIVDANFINTEQNQSVFCDGITNFYRIKIDKGTDYTYTLNLDATAPANFNLFGFANEDHSASGAQLSANNNALGLIYGTIRIGNSIVIPVLSAANSYNISQGARLWINEGTVQKNAGQTITVYGKLKITSGLLEAKVTNGISLALNGTINLDGGIVNANQIRTSDGATNNGAYIQTGGTMNVLGGNTNTDFYVFSLVSTASVFNMSGGILKVNTSTSNGAILINSDPDNIKITGGTVIAETTSTQDFAITSRSPFWNLELKNSTAVARQFSLGAASNIGPTNINIAAQNLQVLNDFRIWGIESGGVSYPVITFDAALKDLYIGGSFYIEKGAKYIAVTGGATPYDAVASQPTARNTTYFNKTAGTGAIEEFYIGEPTTQQELGNFTVDRTSGYDVKLTSGVTRANESVAVDVNGTASVLSGIFDQNLFTLRTWGAIVNNGRMGTWLAGVTPSRAQIQMVENPSLTITTSADAVFGNIQVNVTPPSKITLTSDIYVERLEYVKGLIYLKSYNLKVDNLWNMQTGLFENSSSSSYLKVADSGYSGSSMIITDGNASDGGLTLKVIANSQGENQNNIINNFGPLTYPLGFTTDGGTTLYFRPAQMVVNNFVDDGYVTIRPAMGPLLTANAAGGELLQQYWRVNSSDFSTAPSVSFRFYYRNRTGGNLMDLILVNSANETNYVPGKVLDVSPYTRLYEPLTDNDIIKNIGTTNTRVITFNGTGTGGSFSPGSPGFALENCNYTAGLATCFTGSPTQYFSKASYGVWNAAATWDVGTKGSAVHAVPTAGSIVHIYNDISTAANPGTLGRISVDATGIPNIPAEIIFEMPNLPLDQSSSENIPRLQFFSNGTYNLGVVKGTGMISYGNTAVITNGDFGNFGTNPYSFYLYFVGGPTQLTNIPSPIPNLMIEYPTDINQNISINYDLVIQGDALVHPLQNVAIKRDLVLGFWRGGTFQFPATGSSVKVTVDRDIDFTRIPIAGQIGNRLLNVAITAGTLEHTLIVKRSIIQGSDNNFGINLYGNATSSKAILEFQGTDNGTYTRTSTNVPVLYRIVTNKGTNQTPVFSFDNYFTLSGATNGVTKAIQMLNGTLALNNATIDVNLTTGSANFEIPSTSCLDVKLGTVRANGTSGINLDGKLSVSGGTLNMSGGDNPIEYSASGSALISVTGGTLTVGGQVRRSLTSDNGILNYSQTGGTVVIGNNLAPNGSRGVFEILNAGSSFDMTGGDLYIARTQTSATISAFYFNPATYNIGLAANIHIGHTSTPAAQIFGIFAGKPLPKLRINNQSGNNPIAKLEVTPATITSLLSIDSGSTFNANGLDLNLQGDMTCLGSFIANGNTTYLSGTSTQTITGNISAINFYNLDKTGTNNVALAANTPILVLNELKLRAGTFTTSNNEVNVKGDLQNDATHIYGSSGDGIILSGTVSQTLTGNGIFGKLTVNNPDGIALPIANQFQITNSLKMVSGIINIGKNMLDFGLNAVIEQASPFSLNNMIMTDVSFTDNGVRKTFPSGAQPNFIFPVGSTNKFTPVTLAITANGNSTGKITVKPANEIHPSIVEDTETGAQIVDKNNALQYFWTIQAEGITGFSGTATMKYVDSDALVTAPYTLADYFTASILSDGLGNWLKFSDKADFDELNKNLIFRFSLKDAAQISGDYTAGAGDVTLNGAIPNNVARYETNTNGDWTNNIIWTPNITGGPSGAIAKINATHTVNITSNYISGYMTQLFGRLQVNSTYGHRLGILLGTGVLYNESGDIPAAVYDNFFSSAGGTLEFGGAANDYEFLGNIMEVNHLKLSGNGERRFPNNNVILNGDLTFAGGAGLNSINYYDRKLTIKGNILRTSGNYNSGTGPNATISMAGTLPQTITGSFSNNNALNNLEVKNSNDITIQNDVEINRELLLTNGLISTVSGSLFRINYGGFVTPTNGTPLSFVNGVLTKEMMTGESFTFPIGINNSQKNHGPITLQNISGPIGLNDWSASYLYSNPTDAGYNTANFQNPISTVSISEYWKIQAPAGGQSIISIVLDGSSDVGSSISNLNNLRIVGWNATSSKWEIVGGNTTITGTNTNGTITTGSSVNFDNYTYFTLASTTSLLLSSASFTSPAVVNLCSGTSTTMVVTLSGSQPWSLTYLAGSTPVNVTGITSSPYNITVTPSTTTTYTLTNVTANGTPGVVNGVTAVTVNVSPLPTISITSNAAGNTICQNQSGGITFTATAGLANYTFRVNGTIVQNGASNTYQTLTLAPGSYTVDVIGTNAGNCSTTSTAIAVTVNPIPDAAGAISGSASVCRSSSSTYTVPAIANAISYTWTKDNGATGTSSTNSINLTFPNAGTTTITVRGVNGCGSGVVSTFTVTVNASGTAGNAGIITGSAQICKGSSGITYSVVPVSNATSYIWSYSGAGKTINGTGSSVTIDFSAAATSGNLTVQGTNGCSTGSASPNFAINANTPPTVTIAPLTPSVCSGSSITLTATPVGGTLPYTHSWTGAGASSLTFTNIASPSFSNGVGGNYNLTYTVTDGQSCVGTATTSVNVSQAPLANAGSNLTGLCSGISPIQMTGATAGGSFSGTPTWSGSGGVWTQNPDPALATFTPSSSSGSTTATLTLTGSNGCGDAIATRTISWDKIPNQPGSITGTSTQCSTLAGQTYSITAVANASTYTWNVPTGWLITAGAGTTSITVTTGNAGQNGNITVSAGNTCGTSATTSLAVTVNPGTPATPGAISGTISQCPVLTGQTYSITAVANASTYTWNVPTGWLITAGAGTNSITVTTGTAGQNGNIIVSAGNTCGTSATSSQAVTVNPGTPATPGAISGTISQCPALTGQTYSITAVANASTYTWNVPTGWLITSGAGTSSITVTTGTAGQNGNITVSTGNTCGTSATSSLAVTVNPNASIGSVTGTNALCVAGTTTYTANSIVLGGSGTGAWSSSNSAVATVNGSGLVTGVGAGTCDIIYTITGGCGGTVSAQQPVTITAIPSATISYTGSPFCSNAGIISVNMTGTSGGTYSSTPAGLSVNTSTGEITTATSSPNSYTITYTIAAAGGCGLVTTSTTAIVKLDGSWNGTTGGDWNTLANWDCNTLPSLTTNVLITTGRPNYPTLSTGSVGMTNNLTIQNSASLVVSGNKLQIAGTISNGGSFTASAGTIEMNGAVAQSIPASTFTGNNLKDLIISNSAGVTLTGALNLTGVLTANGNLASDGNLTLISTGSQTALIDGAGTGQVTGTVIMQRYLASGGYKYVSSPFSNATVDQLSGSLSSTATIPNFYSYNENHKTPLGVDMSGWTPYTAGTLSPMAGYSANMGDNAIIQTINLSGTVNNGGFGTTLYNHNQTYTQGFNLIGNPYPSPIDWNSAIGWSRTNIDDALYFFNASGGVDEYSGTYESRVGTIATGGASSIIPSMQGFFVHVTGSSGSLSMTNSVRTNNLNPAFKAASIDQRPILRFTVAFEGKNSQSDPFVLYFDPQSTANFDRDKDALKLTNTDIAVPNFYALTTDTRKLSISGMPAPADSTTRISLGINVLKGNWLNFAAKDITKLPSELNIYLLDKEKNITQDLRKNPTYRFYLPTGEYNQRFALLFEQKDVTLAPRYAERLFAITNIDGVSIIRINLPDNEPGRLFLANMAGQIILEKEVTNLQNVDISSGVNSGLYVVTVTSGERKQSEKTLIRRK